MGSMSSSAAEQPAQQFDLADRSRRDGIHRPDGSSSAPRSSSTAIPRLRLRCLHDALHSPDSPTSSRCGTPRARAAALYATRSSEDVLHAFVNFHRSEPPRGLHGDRDAQRALISEIYAQAGWEIPAILRAMQDAEDLFFDTAGQIRMPSWSKGRVALVGDAATRPRRPAGTGFQSGDRRRLHAGRVPGREPGPCCCLQSLSTRHAGLRDAVQASVDTGGAPLFPITASALEQRNTALRGQVAMPPSAGEPADPALTLPVRLHERGGDAASGRNPRRDRRSGGRGARRSRRTRRRCSATRTMVTMQIRVRCLSPLSDSWRSPT